MNEHIISTIFGFIMAICGGTLVKVGGKVSKESYFDGNVIAVIGLLVAVCGVWGCYTA